MKVNNVDESSVNSMLTMSTDQDIDANAYISEILATNVNAQIFNDFSKFTNSVVLLASNSLIDCKYLWICFMSSNENVDSFIFSSKLELRLRYAM